MSAGRRGRAGAFSLGLIVGFLLLGYAALRVLELSPRSSPAPRAPVDAPAARPDLGAWRARVTTRSGASPPCEVRILARLLPLHDEPALEEFRAAALRSRYGLPAGAPWRLYLALEEPSAAPVVVSAARVGEELVPFAELAQAQQDLDPVHALLAAAPGVLAVGRARAMVLWGRLETTVSELELECTSGADLPLRGAAPLEREEGVDAPRWYAGGARPSEEGHSLEHEVARLERELEHERTRRAEREQAFLEFSRLLAELPVAQQLGLVPEEPRVATAPSPEEVARHAAEEAARARAEELGRALAVLMRLEGLRGLDLLEAGTLQSVPPASIGPVVFRLLDGRGSLAGSLRAERLRLEGSLAAHTLTLVLEQGFESRGGERVPFEGGVRRITLNDVDPEPWLAECPELFAAADLAGPRDDGRWRPSEVRRELNRLLALDTSKGWYRLHSLGGVRGEALLDVQLEELERGGHVARRFLADTLLLLLEDGSVVLELQDGAVLRGGEKQPFRDGRHRLVLPGVAPEPWRAAALPGLAPGPAPGREKPAAAEPGGG